MIPLPFSECLGYGPVPDPLPERIHYACGRRVIDGWLNVDGIDITYPYGTVPVELAAHIVRLDLTQPHPFPGASFQFAYSEDFLEHLPQCDGVLFLAEVYRCLRPGGVFRVSCPGFAEVLRKHYRPNDRAELQVNAYSMWHHVCFWCWEQFKWAASVIGYSRCDRCDYGVSRHAGLCLDSRPDQAELNIVVELTK